MDGGARWTGLALALGCLAACGGDDAVTPDAGAAPDADRGDAAVAGGQPNLLPCADGWRPVDGDGVTVCEPWPESGFERCPAGEAHFPGTPGCALLGPPCPAGDGWATDLPTDQPVVYVRAGSAGGDGSMSSPHDTIEEATLFATGPVVVALPMGTHDEQVMPFEAVTLWGACASGTELTSSTAFFFEGVVDVQAGQTTIRNLTVRGSPDVEGVGVQEGASATLRDVVIADSNNGIFLWGGSLEADGLVVRDSGLQGVEAVGGGDARFSRAVFVDALFGAIAGDLATFELEDVAIVDSAAALVPLGGSVTARRTVVQGSSAAAAFAPEATIDFEDCVIRDTVSGSAAGNDGVGLYLYQGTSATLSRTLLERTQDFAIGVYEAGTSLTATDLVVRDISRETCVRDTCRDSGGGMAIVATEAGQLTMDRFLITRAEICGVMLADGGSMDLTHGEISQSEIGACVQVDAYDLERLSSDVSYRDNGRNLDSTTLPVPTFDSG